MNIDMFLITILHLLYIVCNILEHFYNNKQIETKWLYFLNIYTLCIWWMCICFQIGWTRYPKEWFLCSVLNVTVKYSWSNYTMLSCWQGDELRDVAGSVFVDGSPELCAPEVNHLCNEIKTWS